MDFSFDLINGWIDDATYSYTRNSLLVYSQTTYRRYILCWQRWHDIYNILALSSLYLYHAISYRQNIIRHQLECRMRKENKIIALHETYSKKKEEPSEVLSNWSIKKKLNISKCCRWNKYRVAIVNEVYQLKYTLFDNWPILEQEKTEITTKSFFSSMIVDHN